MGWRSGCSGNLTKDGCSGFIFNEQSEPGYDREDGGYKQYILL